MSIMDAFKNAFSAPSQVPAGMQPQQQPAPANPGNIPANPTMITQGSPDGQIPGGNAQPQVEKSPFAEFEKLWEPAKPVEGAIPDSPIQFKIDPTKVMQSAKQIDFTKTVTPALLEKINAGGEGATQAMMQAMNEMAQTVFAQTMMANTKILESGLESTHQRTSRTIPDAVRKVTVGNALREDNPLFTNPATAPILSALESQLLVQFPNASTAEIKEHARKYLGSFATELTKQSPEYQSQAKQTDARLKETDWSEVPIH
jgi:hypothetical protein